MEQVVRIFRSFEEAEEAENEEYRNMPPERRVEIALELRSWTHPGCN